MSILDCAKAVIEQFVKCRLRMQAASPNLRDRFFLVTSEESIEAHKVV
jgi:hypothetical protein